MEKTLDKNYKLSDDPLWYKDAVIYQVHIKSFCDSNGDGIGDIRGIIEKLDYLENLGITVLWVLPFYPSPLKDDGYDISDYFDIHPQYGTLRDFKELLKEAHNRNIRVITELVINHTSDQHPWFQRARRADSGSNFRDYYVWSDTSEKYKDARIIFKDFEGSNWTWDPAAKAYFWHRFYSHQPDLNFENPQLQKEILKVADFWFNLGVDGMRLDAIPYLFEEEGTNCENLPQTYEFLKKLRGHVDKKFKNKMLLAEANQWPEDAAKYFGDGDACNMAFHFPLMPRMFMSLQMEDRFPIIDILDQTPVIPESGQWAIFLRNHDELTLEMVTDEERDYMYRVYAKDPSMKINLGIRRRLASLLSNNRRKIELINILLFSLPGTPIIYYGDEIGMGDNYYLGDRNGVRTPMQWSSDRNAGFSKANPQKLFLPIIIDPDYHYEAVNVENQERNLSSLMWWMRRVVAMRKEFKAFGRGSIEFFYPDNPKVLVFTRQYKDETILVVINLSRFTQAVSTNLSRFEGHIPEEVFGHNKFPIIKKAPYTLTLGPYDHFWLLLKKEKKQILVEKEEGALQLNLENNWKDILKEPNLDLFQDKILPRYLMKCRWFNQKSNIIKRLLVVEKIQLPEYDGFLIIIEITFTDGLKELYFMSLAFLHKAESEHFSQAYPQSIICRLKVDEEKGFLYDGLYNQALQQLIFRMIKDKRKVKAAKGELEFYPGKGNKDQLTLEAKKDNAVYLLKAEQSNTSIVYNDKFILKIYRHLEEGENPDFELVRYLSEKRNLTTVPSFSGGIQYKRKNADSIFVGMLNGYIANQGNAWNLSLDRLSQYYELLLSKKEKIREIPQYKNSLFDSHSTKVSETISELIDPFFVQLVVLLGKRTRELHDSLSFDLASPEFAPENFTTLYQRSLYQSLQGHAKKIFLNMKKNLKKIPKYIRADVEEVINSEKAVYKSLSRITQKKINSQKFRIHGDYHLGQVLFTGKDFTIIDFEGEPSRPLSERRLKQSPFRDVAGMIRSFHYAAYSALFKRLPLKSKEIRLLEPWAELWYHNIAGLFLKSYIQSSDQSSFIPKEREQIEVLLNTFLLDKAVYEMNYELNNRPEWIMIPVKGIKSLINSVS